MDVGANIQGLPFPWFTQELAETSKQNYQKDWCDGSLHTFKLITPYYKLPPFQIKRGAMVPVNNVTTWNLINLNSGVVTDLLAIMQANTLEYESTGEVDYIVYKANLGFTSTLPEGFHYSVISDGTNTWYSEVIWIDCFVDPDDAGEVLGIGDGFGLLVESPGDFLLTDLNNFVVP